MVEVITMSLPIKVHVFVSRREYFLVTKYARVVSLTIGSVDLTEV